MVDLTKDLHPWIMGVMEPITIEQLVEPIEPGASHVRGEKIPAPLMMLPDDPEASGLLKPYTIGIRPDVYAQLRSLKRLMEDNTGSVFTTSAVIALLIGWFEFSHGLYTGRHRLNPTDGFMSGQELATFARVFFGGSRRSQARLRVGLKPLHWGVFFQMIAERNRVDFFAGSGGESQHGRTDPNSDGRGAG